MGEYRMEMEDLVSEDLVITQLKGEDKEQVMEEMAKLLSREDILSEPGEYLQAVRRRESECSTGIGYGIAIPHGKSEAVKKSSIAIGKKKSGLDWQSLDGDLVKIVFMIAVPKERAGDEHLQILQQLSRKLLRNDFRDKLRKAETAEEIVQIMKKG